MSFVGNNQAYGRAFFNLNTEIIFFLPAGSRIVLQSEKEGYITKQLQYKYDKAEIFLKQESGNKYEYRYIVGETLTHKARVGERIWTQI